MAELNINWRYKKDPLYDIETRMERINLDNEAIWDMNNGNGFRIYQSDNIKKNIKEYNGVFSTRFGRQLSDLNAFADRYKCKCGFTEGKINHGMKCKICGEEVKFLHDNFSYSGWIILKDQYKIIHPNLFKSINFLTGGNLENIIRADTEKDQDGYNITNKEVDEDNPYYGIGLDIFEEKFDEVMAYYRDKNPNKTDYYEDIMANKEKVFTHSIHIFSSLLRPFNCDGQNSFDYDSVNGYYNMMAKLANEINKDNLRIYRRRKPKMQLLFDLQMKQQKVYDEVVDILSGKKGRLRNLVASRLNFTSRNVIVEDPMLGVDEITLSYAACVTLLEQQIINILHKSQNMSYADAYRYLSEHCVQEDATIKHIIMSLINSPKGINVLINRNPTIQLGSILKMKVVGINSSYTMGLNLQILELLAADFDGDVLNILYIINDEFLEACERIFNVRNAFFISRNDGLTNIALIPQRDSIINLNTLIHISRKNYTPEHIARIKRLQGRAV